jgi:hypothetical protein
MTCRAAIIAAIVLLLVTAPVSASERRSIPDPDDPQPKPRPPQLAKD